MAIWEMLATENEEDCANPIDRKLEEIRAIKQDQQGQERRKSVFHFSAISVECTSLIHMMNRDRRARIDGGGLDPSSEEAILRMPHEHIPALEGLIVAKGGGAVRCTKAAAYHMHSTAMPIMYKGLGPRYREIKHKIATKVAAAREDGTLITAKEIRTFVKRWEKIHSQELAERPFRTVPRRQQQQRPAAAGHRGNRQGGDQRGRRQQRHKNFRGQGQNNGKPQRSSNKSGQRRDNRPSQASKQQSASQPTNQ